MPGRPVRGGPAPPHRRDRRPVPARRPRLPGLRAHRGADGFTCTFDGSPTWSTASSTGC